jgi:hypothetical protein
MARRRNRAHHHLAGQKPRENLALLNGDHVIPLRTRAKTVAAFQVWIQAGRRARNCVIYVLDRKFAIRPRD